MKMHAIEAKNLYYTYSDGQRAVNGMSFCIEHGEAVGIVGSNGAGKSTLLMLLMGVLKAASGEALVDGIPVEPKNLGTIRRKLGMVFQDPDDQLFMPTIYDDVAFGPRNYKLDEKEVESRVIEALDSVGILHLKDRAPFRLSGGEKRAAAIASVLSMKPEILFMDEPTAALDPKSRRRVINFLKGFPRTRIIASHDLDMVYEVCEKIIVIKEGTVAACGAAAETLADPVLMDESGLEMPLSLQACPRCGLVSSFLPNL